MKLGSAQRGNALLIVLCLTMLIGAVGFMFYGFKKGQSFKNTPAPANTASAEVRGTKIGEPVAAPATNAAPAKEVAANTTPAPTQVAAATTNNLNKPLKLEKVVTGEGREYFTVGFDVLSGFEYVIPDETTTNKTAAAESPKDQIPTTIRSLNKKQVALKGFMLPLKVEGGLITELLIMRDQSMCCYGAVPKINEWVSVKMTSKGIKPIMDQAVTLYGTLKVGEIRENGYLVGIYEMDGDKMAGPLDL